MNSTTDAATFSMPIPFEAHDIAKTLTAGLDRPQKSQQVYLNTLAIYAVDYYLRLMGFETDWPHSDSRDPLYVKVMDIADLRIKNLGTLECRPILPDSDYCDIPFEAQGDRIGFAVIEINPSLKEATILGFTPTADQQITRRQLKPLDDLLEMLTELEKNPSPIIHSIQEWLNRRNEEAINGWQQLKSLLTGDPQLAYQLLYSQEVLETQRGKLFNLGMDLQNQPLALIVVVTPEDDDQLTIQIKLRPEQERDFLPPELELALLSETGELLQSVKSRTQDNWIQLPRFRGEVGECFQIQVQHKEAIMTEKFRL